MRTVSLAVFALVTTALRPAGAQTLSRSDAQRGIQAVRPAVDHCLRSAAVSSIVKVRLEIADGRVAAIQVQDAGAASACVERAVRAARFPRSSRPMTVLYPFVTRRPTPAARPSAPAGALLSREQVARGIHAIRPAVARCRAGGTAPVLVTVRLEIAGGRVIGAQGASKAATASTIACVERAVVRAVFPLAPRMTVRYPFALH